MNENLNQFLIRPKHGTGISLIELCEAFEYENECTFVEATQPPKQIPISK